MQDHDPGLALDRRTLLAGLGALTVTAAASGCGRGESSQPPPWVALGPIAEVPVGGGRIYPQHRVVVTQPVQGSLHAFSAVCTHQGCTVAEVEGGTINCRCHGSRFDAGDGSVVRGPAQQPLSRLGVAVEAGSITVGAAGA